MLVAVEVDDESLEPVIREVRTRGRALPWAFARVGAFGKGSGSRGAGIDGASPNIVEFLFVKLNRVVIGLDEGVELGSLAESRHDRVSESESERIG